MEEKLFHGVTTGTRFFFPAIGVCGVGQITGFVLYTWLRLTLHLMTVSINRRIDLVPAAGLRSGDVTPSSPTRPLSALSQVSSASTVATIGHHVRARTAPAGGRK